MFPKTFRNALVIAATIAMPSLASAGQPFDAKAFQASQAAGKSILVDVTAPWCPTCKQQKPIVQEIEKEHPDLGESSQMVETGVGDGGIDQAELVQTG